jgi:hypothetical protein
VRNLKKTPFLAKCKVYRGFSPSAIEKKKLFSYLGERFENLTK